MPAEDEATIALYRPRTSEIAAFKQAVTDLLTEYYSSGDLNEAAVSLQVGIRGPRQVGGPESRGQVQSE